MERSVRSEHPAGAKLAGTVKRWAPEYAITYGESHCWRCGERMKDGERFQSGEYYRRSAFSTFAAKRVYVVHVICPRKVVKR